MMAEHLIAFLAAASIKLAISAYQAVVEAGDGAVTPDEAWAKGGSSGFTENNLKL